MALPRSFLFSFCLSFQWFLFSSLCLPFASLFHFVPFRHYFFIKVCIYLFIYSLFYFLLPFWHFRSLVSFLLSSTVFYFLPIFLSSFILYSSDPCRASVQLRDDESFRYADGLRMIRILIDTKRSCDCSVLSCASSSEEIIRKCSW